MKKTTHLASAALIYAGLLASTAAVAQEGADEFVFETGEEFVFEEEQVETVTAPSAPVARYLQDGISYYEREDFLAASGFFWRVINEPDVSADSLRPRAQFELAKTLVRLRLLQGALILFDEIIAEGPTHPFFEASAEWLIVIARRLPGDAEMLRRISAFADLFPDRIEGKYRDELAYYLGQHFFNVGERERALQFLGFVTEVSSFYNDALFLRGITYIRLEQPREAITEFEQLEELTRRGSADRNLNELAQLSLARTYYGAGDYERALDYYRGIPRNSEYWLDSLFESSWGYYQIEQFNRSLGNLHSLNSPFFNDEYYPEAGVLQAVILFYNCRWPDVRVTLEEFEFTYAPLLDDLRTAIASFVDDTEYYEFLLETRGRSGRRFDPRLQQIVNATLQDRTIRNAVAFIEELEIELEYIADADPGWSNSDIGSFLRQEILATRDFAQAEAGSLVRARLQGLASDLAGHERAMASIQIETDLAEANAISDDLAAELYRGDSEDDVRSASNEYMVWSFDGEYWRDELGYYYYHINSQCE